MARKVVTDHYIRYSTLLLCMGSCQLFSAPASADDTPYSWTRAQMQNTTSSAAYAPPPSAPQGDLNTIVNSSSPDRGGDVYVLQAPPGADMNAPTPAPASNTPVPTFTSREVQEAPAAPVVIVRQQQAQQAPQPDPRVAMLTQMSPHQLASLAPAAGDGGDDTPLITLPTDQTAKPIAPPMPAPPAQAAAAPVATAPATASALPPLPPVPAAAAAGKAAATAPAATHVQVVVMPPAAPTSPAAAASALPPLPPVPVAAAAPAAAPQITQAPAPALVPAALQPHPAPTPAEQADVSALIDKAIATSPASPVSDATPLVATPAAVPDAPAAAPKATPASATTKKTSSKKSAKKTSHHTTHKKSAQTYDANGEPISTLPKASTDILSGVPSNLADAKVASKSSGPVNISHTKDTKYLAATAPADGAKQESMGMKVEVDNSSKVNSSYELQTAYEALVSGNSEDAIELYKRVLTGDPDNKNALFGLGTAYHRAGQLDMARGLYGKLLQIDPGNRDALNNFLVLLADEAPEAALTQLEKLEQKNPGFSPIPAQMAVIYMRQGDFDKASQKMFRAIQLAPENLTYRYNLAIMLDKQHKYEEASRLYKQIIEAASRGESTPGNINKIQERLTFISSNGS